MSDAEVRQTGHLAINPEMTYVGEGKDRIARTSFVVINNKRRKDRETGDVIERATRIRWTLWREQAENAMKFLRKGSHVQIRGRLENNDYEKDGDMQYGFNFMVLEIDYLDSKAEAEARAARAASGGQDDDDIPY